MKVDSIIQEVWEKDDCPSSRTAKKRVQTRAEGTLKQHTNNNTRLTQI